MSTVFKYEGVFGKCHYNPELKAFVGELCHTDYLVTFRGGTIKEAKNNFIAVTKKYLDSKNKQNNNV